MKKMFVVMKREYLQAVRKKSFIILTVLMPVLFAGVILVPALILGKTLDKKTVMVVDGTGRLESAIQGVEEPVPEGETAGEESVPEEIRESSGQIETKYVNASGAADVREFAEPYIKLIRAKDVDEADKIDAVLIVPRGAFESSDEPMIYYSRTSTDLIVRERLGRNINKEIQRVRLSERGVPPEDIDSILDRLDVSSVQVTKTGEEKKGGEMDFMVAFLFAGLLLMPSLIYGVEVMRGVIQEKTDRVVEILISSMKPMHLLSGKIMGLAAVGMTQLAVWLTVAGVAAAYTGGMMANADFNITQFLRAEIFFYFFVFFVLGYMMYVCVYAVAGAICNSEKEAQQFVTPVMMLFLVPWFLMMAIILNPDSGLSVVLSIFPLFAPITMFVRVLVSDPPLWQVLSAIFLCLATIWGMFWLTAKIFRVGILSYGKRPTIPELWRWVKVA